MENSTNNIPCGDELIEITPDIYPEEEDSDITMSESPLCVEEPIVEKPEPDGEESEMVGEITESLSKQIAMMDENADIPEQVDIADSLADEAMVQKGFLAWFINLPVWAYVMSGAVVLAALLFCWCMFTQSGRSLIIRIGSRYISSRVSYVPVDHSIADLSAGYDEQLINVADNEETPIADKDVTVFLPGTEQAVSSEDILRMADNADLPDIDAETEQPGQLSTEETIVTIATDSAITAQGNPIEVPGGAVTEPTSGMTEEAQHIYNILLIGEENIFEDQVCGRSDVIMIVSVDVVSRSIKLTSILRDTYVDIAGHNRNRINASYVYGGVALLEDTIEKNFGITCDNYIRLSFDDFRRAVDEFGYIDIEVTPGEAVYLNNTNFISSRANRTIIAGINPMNGDQLLGYCRISKVGTADKEFNDCGRTARQRRVIGAIYERFTSMGYLEMLRTVDACLPYLVTDINAQRCEMYLKALVGTDPIGELQTLRVPRDGEYKDLYAGTMLVADMDKEKTVEAIRRFIYGGS